MSSITPLKRIYTEKEKDLRNVFHNTTRENIHGKGPEKEYHVYFKSSSYEDFISSEGELPKLIQTHLEWKVIQALLDMRELIESNSRIYRKNSQETFQGPVALEECLKKRFLETFLKNRRYILDTVLRKFFFQEGIMDHDKIAQVLLANLAHVLQCLTVEVLAKIYGIKEYHLHEMLEETVFKEECSTIIGHYIRENLLRLLPPCFFNYECNNLQNERDRLSGLFSNTHHKTFVDELKKIQETDWMHIANIVHQELEEKVKPTERNLLIQHKQKFEINSILKQTMASNYKSYQLPPSKGPTEELKHDLHRIDGVEGVAMVCGELQVHVTNFSSVENEKKVLQEINQVITRYKYRQSYKIGIITRKPKLYYSVGSTLHCPVLNRRGTLGGFVIDTDGKLYFLTCAHIVPNNVDVHVEIRGQQVGPITIGRSVIMQVPAKNQHISVDCCDIMAVRVNADQIPRCIPFFKTADGEFGSSVMVQPFNCSLEELHDVYKWGATTNLTRGLLHTGDYNKELFVSCNLNDHKYIYVLVETPPVDDDNHGTLPLPGDSGAIICTEIEDKIQTIAMIQGGDMSIRTGPSLTNYIIGFYLWGGLDKLFERSGLNLNTVPFSEQNL